MKIRALCPTSESNDNCKRDELRLISNGINERFRYAKLFLCLPVKADINTLNSHLITYLFHISFVFVVVFCIFLIIYINTLEINAWRNALPTFSKHCFNMKYS